MSTEDADNTSGVWWPPLPTDDTAQQLLNASVAVIDYTRRLPWLETFVPTNMRELHRINGIVVLTLSILLNTVLITLIVTERNATLKAYSRVLLQNCIIDLMFTVSNAVVDLQIEFTHGYFILIVNNPWTRELPMYWHYLLLLYYGSSCTLAIHAAPVIFYFRYELMCKGTVLSTSRILACTGTALFFAVSRISILTLAVFLNEPHRVELCSRLLDHPIFWEPGTNAPSPKCMVSNVSTIFLPIYLSLALICDGVCYKVMMYFTYAIYKEMKMTQQKFSGKTARLQRQMNHLLMAQMLLPLFTAILPASTIVFFTWLRIDIPGAGLVVITLLSWIPLVSPLTTIVLVSNFRQKLLQLMTANGRGKSSAANATGEPRSLSVLPQLSNTSSLRFSTTNGNENFNNKCGI